MGYLAEQTGGIAVANTNDLAAGLRRATDDVRSYYIIGFTPSDGLVRRAWQRHRASTGSH